MDNQLSQQVVPSSSISPSSIPLENVTPPPSNSKKKIILIAVTILMLILIGGSGYYLVNNTLTQKQTSVTTTVTQTPSIITATPSMTIAPTEIPIPTLSTTDTSSWVTINNKNRYSIKYPSELRAGNEGYGDIPSDQSDWLFIQHQGDSFNKPLLKIYAFSEKGTQYEGKFTTLEEIAQLSFKDNTTSPNIPAQILTPLTKTTFQGNEAYEFEIKRKGFQGIGTGFLGEEGDIKVIITKYKDMYYWIGYYNQKPFTDIFSTFKLN